MVPIEVFATQRLVGERVQLTDYDDLCAMHSDPVTMATLGGVRSDATTLEFLRQKMDHWETYGHGLWIFRDKPHHQFVGRGLLEHIVVGGNDEVEVGYSLVSAQWRQGLATEMAKAIVSIAFHCLDVTSIVSFTYPDNFASRRVMEKAGFVYEREIQHVGRPHVLYRITRRQFSGKPTLEFADGTWRIE